MNATIEIDGLRKRFGSTQALDGMTFTVRPGQVTGFVGPNGAGKSTTMRVIVGLDAPDAGTTTIGGRPYRSLKNPLRHVGSLLDAGGLQPSRSARNHLTEHTIPFSEVTAHRATLEQAYMELTRESVEYRAEATS